MSADSLTPFSWRQMAAPVPDQLILIHSFSSPLIAPPLVIPVSVVPTMFLLRYFIVEKYARINYFTLAGSIYLHV